METLRGQFYGCMGRIWIPTGRGRPQKNTTLILGNTLLCLKPTSAIVFERLFEIFDVEFCYSEIVIATPLKHSPRSGNFLMHLENALRQFARLNFCEIRGVFAIRFFCLAIAGCWYSRLRCGRFYLAHKRPAIVCDDNSRVNVLMRPSFKHLSALALSKHRISIFVAGRVLNEHDEYHRH